MKNKNLYTEGKSEFPDVTKIEKETRAGAKKITEVPETPDDIPYRKSPEEVPDFNPDEADKKADDPDTAVSASEKKDLASASEKMQTDDENALQRATLDQTDEEGDLLNERSGLSGSDLDVPGSEADDADEAIGEEDEENNSFSTDNETEDKTTGMD